MDINNNSPEEYGIWLVNTINVSVKDLNLSYDLSIAEIERSLHLLGSIRGVSKISKITYLKKVKIYVLNNMK